jgi:Ca2+/Na+ antiporter
MKQQPKTKPKKENKHKYIFPNFMAMAMKNANMQTQLESAMMSMTLLLIGMILMSVYTMIYLTQGWVFKGLMLFNLIAGFLFMSSYLVTTYQQYSSYMIALEVQSIMHNTPIVPRQKNRLNQFLFFVGLFLIAGSILSYFLLVDNSYRYIISGSLALIGLIMVIIVFIRKPKKNNKDNEEKIKEKLNTDYSEINQSRELEQGETGVSDLMDNQLTSEQELDEFDKQVLDGLEQEEARAQGYVDYTRKKYKGDTRYFK